MKYKAYKFNFSTAVHIGRQRLSDAEYVLHADTLFSASCNEAVNTFGEETLLEFVNMVKEDKVRFSDGMPYYKDTYFIPKPLISVETEQEGDSVIKKAVKKLKYIDITKVDEYLLGTADVKRLAETLNHMGKTDIRTMASVEELNDTTPFSVGTYTFGPGWGLYVIVGYTDDNSLNLIEDLLVSLGYTGIGGKKSSGLGKFDLNPGKLGQDTLSRLTIHEMSGKNLLLSTSMSSDDELEQTLDGASYKLERRGGFIQSQTFAPNPMRKKDIHMFKSGSVFTHTFDGIIADVSCHGSHPVYRYGKPIFWRCDNG